MVDFSNVAGFEATRRNAAIKIVATQLVRDAILRGSQQFSKELVDYLTVVTENFRNVREGIAADSAALAAEMESAAMEQINATRQRRADPSRAGAGRFPGMIEQALKSTFIPTTEGVIVDLATLNNIAPHYKRIDAGAGGIAGQNPFQTGSLGDIIPSQAAFGMPKGYFSDSPSGDPPRFGPSGGAGNQFFFPTGKQILFPTRGIQGKFFLEAAVEKAAIVFPQIVANRVNQWYASVARGGSPRIAEILL